MPGLRRQYKVPSELLPNLRAFSREICNQALENNSFPAALKVSLMPEIDDSGRRLFQVDILGDPKTSRQIADLCLAAEKGKFKLPVPNNIISRKVGVVGEKINFQGVLYFHVSLSGGKFGAEHLHRFKDLFGNELYWLTGTRLYPKGFYQSIQGKVKSHDNYDGVVQTRLTHVKFNQHSPLKEV